MSQIIERQELLVDTGWRNYSRMSMLATPRRVEVGFVSLCVGENPSLTFQNVITLSLSTTQSASACIVDFSAPSKYG